MRAFERCQRCQEIVRFTLDNLGRLVVVCPVCHEGQKPSLSRPNHRPPATTVKSFGTRYCELDECGKPYEANSGNQRFCSDACNDRSRRRVVGTRQCRGCKFYFTPNSKSHACCSHECRTKVRTESFSRTTALRRAARKEAQSRHPNAAA